MQIEWIGFMIPWEKGTFFDFKKKLNLGCPLMMRMIMKIVATSFRSLILANSYLDDSTKHVLE